MATRFAKLNLRCIRGCEWNDDVVLRNAADESPVSLAGADEILLRARDDGGNVILELRLTEDTLVFVTDGTDGKIGIRADSALTNTLPAAGHEDEPYPYDIQILRGIEWEPGTKGVLVVEAQTGRPLDDTP